VFAIGGVKRAVETELPRRLQTGLPYGDVSFCYGSRVEQIATTSRQVQCYTNQVSSLTLSTHQDTNGEFNTMTVNDTLSTVRLFPNRFLCFPFLDNSVVCMHCLSLLLHIIISLL